PVIAFAAGPSNSDWSAPLGAPSPRMLRMTAALPSCETTVATRPVFRSDRLYVAPSLRTVVLEVIAKLTDCLSRRMSVIELSESEAILPRSHVTEIALPLLSARLAVACTVPKNGPLTGEPSASALDTASAKTAVQMMSV